MTASGKGASASWHLWVVGVMSLLWNAFGVFDFTATITRFEPYMGAFPQELKDYWAAMPWWQYVIWVVGVFGAFAGSVLLLMRRRMAVELFGASLVGAVLSLVVSKLQPPTPEYANNPMAIVIVAIAAALLGYAFWMRAKGALR